MKAILMSIRPEWVAKILNGEKTIEIRKKFPKDYVGWVYIYVTQNHKHASWKNRDTLKRDSHDGKPTNHFQLWTDDMVEDKDKLNGKVVARFWCDKVEEIKLPYTKFGTNEWVGGECERTLQTETMDEETLLEKSCLSETEIYKYLNFKHSPNYCGCAIHITKVEPFDRPKEISEFSIKVFPHRKDNLMTRYLTRAPQSWCYVEI